jgi:hypothetical protein
VRAHSIQQTAWVILSPMKHNKASGSHKNGMGLSKNYPLDKTSQGLKKYLPRLSSIVVVS